MGWKNRIQAARESGQQIVNQQADTIIEEHWPQIQLLICGKDGPAALAAAHDDEKMELLFKAVYAALPFPVHLAVQVASFIKFCFTHRDQLLSCGEAAAGAAGREVVWGEFTLHAGSSTGLQGQ